MGPLLLYRPVRQRAGHRIQESISEDVFNLLGGEDAFGPNQELVGARLFDTAPKRLVELAEFGRQLTRQHSGFSLLDSLLGSLLP